MTTLDDKLQLIKTYKSDMQETISNRGIEITSTTPLSEYSSKISEIESPLTFNTTFVHSGAFVDPTTHIASGFSTSSYLKTGYIFQPNGANWKQTIKFTTGSNTSQTQGIYTSTGSHDNCTPFYCLNGVFTTFLSSDGSSWDIANGTISILTLATNTEYYISCEYDGSKYVWKRYINGTWRTLYTLNTSTSVINATTEIQIGTNRGSNNAFLGTIDLNSMVIEIDGVETYRAVS